MRRLMKLGIALAMPLAFPAPGLAASPPAPAPDSALAEGQVIPAGDNASVGGWGRVYGSRYIEHSYIEGAGRETEKCCFSIFTRGNALMVLRTEAVTRDANGNPLTERILRNLWVTRRADEQITDCTILWIVPQLSLYDAKTEMIRSVVIQNGEFTLIEWRDPGSACSLGD